jgi:hypothetical protein
MMMCKFKYRTVGVWRDMVHQTHSANDSSIADLSNHSKLPTYLITRNFSEAAARAVMGFEYK